MRDPFDQVVPPLDGVESTGVHSAILVDLEISVGGLQQGVVLGGLDLVVPGIQDLPRGQWLEDRIGQVHVLPKAGPGIKEVNARMGHDALIHINRGAAVVSDIIHTEHERWHPEKLRSC